ncbi:hypothetical protein ACIA59_21830 [Micromonospora haikouensis]|uniref:hypothetical protein n=1 Tax=Micromonospora haikouensis TaxID=686309 RepID=UPI00378DC818
MRETVYGDLRFAEADTAVEVRTKVRARQRMPRKSARFSACRCVAETSRGRVRNYPQHYWSLAPYPLVERSEKVLWCAVVDVVQP